MRISIVKRDARHDVFGPVVHRDGHTVSLLEHTSVVVHQAAGRKSNHTMRLLRLTHKVFEDLRRLLPEGGHRQQLSFQALNGGAKGVLNLGIQVEKSGPKSRSQPLPNGGFSNATHTDEANF